MSEGDNDNQIQHNGFVNHIHCSNGVTTDAPALLNDHGSLHHFKNNAYKHHQHHSNDVTPGAACPQGHSVTPGRPYPHGNFGNNDDNDLDTNPYTTPYENLASTRPYTQPNEWILLPCHLIQHLHSLNHQ